MSTPIHDATYYVSRSFGYWFWRRRFVRVFFVFFLGGGGGGGREGGGQVNVYEQMFEMAFLLLKENNCVKLC